MNLLCCFEDTSTDSLSKPTVTSSIKSTKSLSEDALELCRNFDKNGDGYLTKKEIMEAVGDTYTKKEIEEMLAKADTNHDGKVDYKEFFNAAFSKE